MPNIQISVAELRKHPIFIATPMYGGQCLANYTRSMVALAQLFTKLSIEFRFYSLTNESLITRARNYCADEFLRARTEGIKQVVEQNGVKKDVWLVEKDQPFPLLLFLDADIGFNPQDVLAMMAMSIQKTYPQHDVLGAPYPKKCISWEKIARAMDKGAAEKNPNNLENFVGDFVFNALGASFNIEAPAEMLEVGTGFMLIRRQTLEKYAAFYPQYMYRPDHARTKEFDGSREIMMFFQAEIDQYDPTADYKAALEAIKGGANSIDIAVNALAAATDKAKGRSKRYLSEDYLFCQNVRKMGGRVWLLPWMQLSHTGTYTFGGSLKNLASVGVSPTVDHNDLKKVQPGTVMAADFKAPELAPLGSSAPPAPPAPLDPAALPTSETLPDANGGSPEALVEQPAKVVEKTKRHKH